jgi:uncharacterized protein (DUF849 family)
MRKLTHDVAAGAGSSHPHPRVGDAGERLDADVVDKVVSPIRQRCAMPVAVSARRVHRADFERSIAPVAARRPGRRQERRRVREHP